MGNRDRRSATHRRQQFRFASFNRSVHDVERTDVVAILIDIAVENDTDRCFVSIRSVHQCQAEYHADEKQNRARLFEHDGLFQELGTVSHISVAMKGVRLLTRMLTDSECW